MPTFELQRAVAIIIILQTVWHERMKKSGEFT
jgi:hypothetical protein